MLQEIWVAIWVHRLLLGHKANGGESDWSGNQGDCLVLIKRKEVMIYSRLVGWMDWSQCQTILEFLFLLWTTYFEAFKKRFFRVLFIFIFVCPIWFRNVHRAPGIAICYLLSTTYRLFESGHDQIFVEIEYEKVREHHQYIAQKNHRISRSSSLLATNHIWLSDPWSNDHIDALL